MNNTAKIRVLFVCMGNICRSPTAHGVFRHMVEQHGLEEWFEIDCAGTHAYHLGLPPDPRAQEASMRRGIDISHLRARRATAEDFQHFDYVLAMDMDNRDILLSLCPREHEHKLSLLMAFAPELNIEEVPDPYYGGTSGFERVIDMIEKAAEGLLIHIHRERLSHVAKPLHLNSQ
jgi:protein-tyrosine phosphatase